MNADEWSEPRVFPKPTIVHKAVVILKREERVKTVATGLATELSNVAGVGLTTASRFLRSDDISTVNAQRIDAWIRKNF